jgi:hypothetical protein
MMHTGRQPDGVIHGSLRTTPPPYRSRGAMVRATSSGIGS